MVKKIPRARTKDTIEDLQEDGMVGSEGWKTFKTKKKKQPTLP
jgi:hypothetical protein